MELTYEKFLRIFENADKINVDETTFYFDDDPEEQEHYLGWIGGQDKPYWVGYCDITDGCEYSSAEEMFTAKIYDGAVVFISERDGDWFRIKSGNAEGYVMCQYFLYGEHLAEQILMDEPYTREELLVDKSYSVGITLEEEEAIRLAKEEEERKERERIAKEQEAARKKAMEAGNSYSLEDTTELRKELVNYACQFVGLKYVMGGNSLETGTDCSGFTKLIYAHFGYGIDRTPSGQYNNNGRLVSYAEAQPGDIIIYGKNGVCTHAAIYIGDGKIVHAANSRQNTYIGNATYNTIMGVKNIID